MDPLRERFTAAKGRVFEDMRQAGRIIRERAKSDTESISRRMLQMIKQGTCRFVHKFGHF